MAVMNEVRMLDDAVAASPRTGLGRLISAGRARWAHHRLDVALADGRNPWSSPALTRRAGILTSQAERQRIASSIVSLVRLAELGRPASACLRIRRNAVLDHREELLALAARLAAAEPVAVATVAQLVLLVRDEGSPVFEGGRPADQVATVVRSCVLATGSDTATA